MTVVTRTAGATSRHVIVRSLVLGMAAWTLSVFLGVLALVIGAVLAVVLAPPGKRVLALAWSVAGGLAALALLAMPFILPAELSTTG